MNGDVVSRRTFPLHVTCSAVAVDAVGDVLMMWHRGHGRWRLPGGHIEPGDPSMYGAALRGLEAVTGVAWCDTIPAVPEDDIPVDIKVHAVPPIRPKGSRHMCMPTSGTSSWPMTAACPWRARRVPRSPGGRRMTC
ncbi:NUDIX domain-containing protein [Nonomuraea sp. NPDC049400]|uniref:NUDIX domain-containing protein n=1 Tax=Nonomuraea sp. NPDC049400 TaxID=3364352 RepID=UPI0037A08036